MNSSDRVEDLIKTMGLKWKLYRLQKRVRRVSQAASALGVPESLIVKTIVLIDDDRTIACIIPGDKKLDLRKVRAVIGGSPRLARPEEVLERTGYSVGGVPPYPLPDNIIIMMDERVLDNERVYGGGGDEWTLLEFSPKELISMVRVLVADISL